MENIDKLRIHSVETFGTHDGPGIRLVVFVQGCQFKCLYCQNPDTLDPNGGQLIPVADLMKKAISQKPYFKNGGGVTVSGGEPLLQRETLIDFFKQLKANGIHTCLDSNGRVLDQATQDLLEQTDLLMLDVKHIDNQWHKDLTGLKNKTTLKMAAYREKTNKPMWLRYVLVPGWTDQEEYLHQWAAYFKDYKSVQKVEIIPFHQLGKHKWGLMGMDYQLNDVNPPTVEMKEKAKAIFEQYLSNVVVK